MTTEQIMQLAYLVLLATAIGGSVVAAGRNDLGRMAQQAAVWGLIFVGVIAAYALWGDISQTVLRRPIADPQGAITLMRDADGHYTVDIGVNGTPVRFMVDTGASDIVLSERDARRVGIDPAGLTYSGFAVTANGSVRTAPVTLDRLTLGDFNDGPIRAVVNGGAMDESLLGMRYLGLFDRIEIRNGTMILTR